MKYGKVINNKLEIILMDDDSEKGFVCSEQIKTVDETKEEIISKMQLLPITTDEKCTLDILYYKFEIKEDGIVVSSELNEIGKSYSKYLSVKEEIENIKNRIDEIKPTIIKIFKKEEVENVDDVKKEYADLNKRLFELRKPIRINSENKK